MERMLEHIVNMYPARVASGITACFLSTFTTELKPLVVAAVVFEAIDFVTGVLKSAVVAHRKGERAAFESIKAWRTIYKCVFILVGIWLANVLDGILTEGGTLRLANYFTAFCCGVEFWSFLENAAVISDHQVFRWLRKFMKLKVEDQLGMTMEQAKEGSEKPTE